MKKTASNEYKEQALQIRHFEKNSRAKNSKLKEKLKDYTKSGLCDSTISEPYIDTYVEILQNFVILRCY